MGKKKGCFVDAKTANTAFFKNRFFFYSVVSRFVNCSVRFILGSDLYQCRCGTHHYCSSGLSLEVIS